MKYSYSFFFLLIALTSCFSISAQNSQGSKTIPVAAFQKLLNETKRVQLVDVRTPEEYADGHLQHAVNIDYEGDNFKKELERLDKTKTTMIYCLSGGRSASAMKVLKNEGFNDIYNMQGGIMAWQEAKLPLANRAPVPEWKGMSVADYKSLIAGDIPVVIDFNAKWCGPCKQLKPILDEIQKEYKGKIKIIPIDVDENKSLALSMYVRNIPLLIYHEKGKVIMNQEGMLDKEGLIALFKLRK